MSTSQVGLALRTIHITVPHSMLTAMYYYHPPIALKKIYTSLHTITAISIGFDRPGQANPAAPGQRFESL